MTRSMLGSHRLREGKERKERTLLGEDIWVMCRPRANSRPAANWTAWFAALFEVLFPLLFIADMPATRRGNNWHAIIVAAAKMTSEIVDSRDGYKGV
jgi:hypothetical protein